uniref:Uncharacterized protein n=1 Tax=viral metagenome TaxID=1070528 RepID=A0A6M3LS96_9ZZZZ
MAPDDNRPAPSLFFPEIEPEKEGISKVRHREPVAKQFDGIYGTSFDNRVLMVADPQADDLRLKWRKHINPLVN